MKVELRLVNHQQVTDFCLVFQIKPEAEQALHGTGGHMEAHDRGRVAVTLALVRLERDVARASAHRISTLHQRLFQEFSTIMKPAWTTVRIFRQLI